MSEASRTGRRKTSRRRAASGRSQRDVHGRRNSAHTQVKKKKTRKTRERRFEGIGPLIQDMRLQREKKLDAPLVMITMMLLGIGLIAVLSSSYPKAYYNSNTGPLYYFIRQLGMAGIGLVAMWFVSCVNYHRYERWVFPIYALSILLLILTLTKLGTSINDAQRWLFGFQPSEIAKLSVILLFSAVASRNRNSVRAIKSLLLYAVLIGILIVLLALEPHMSAAMILVVIAFGILFVAGMEVWFLIPVGIAGSIIMVIAYFTMEHIRTRFIAFLDPFSVATGKGWQAVQSLIAIGSGGAFGLGLGQSRQKFLYLPEPFNDFIFSVVCEELGFIGAALILILFAYFVFRGFTIAMRAQDRFGCLVATGITIQFAFQILLNLAVVSGLFPVTGASLPLFSYGGTALIMQLMEIGILLNISRNIPPSRKE